MLLAAGAALGFRPVALGATAIATETSTSLSTRPVALVTGGTRGVGAGIAKRLAPTHDLVLSSQDFGETSIDFYERLLDSTPARIQLVTGDVASEATLERMRAAVDELGPLRLAVHAMRSPVVDGFLDLVMDDGAVVMVTPRPMHDLDRYAEQLRERRVSANAVVVESPDGIVVADVADVVSFLASDAGRLISGQNLPLRARVA